MQAVTAAAVVVTVTVLRPGGLGQLERTTAATARASLRLAWGMRMSGSFVLVHIYRPATRNIQHRTPACSKRLTASHTQDLKNCRTVTWQDIETAVFETPSQICDYSSTALSLNFCNL